MDYWTKFELEILRVCYARNSAEDLLRMFPGRSIKAIGFRARKLGLTKSENSGRFKKGQKVWNAGRKDYRAGGRSVETQFKPGFKPHTTLPLGSLRITKDGTLQRKVSETSGSMDKRWRSVHELVWIEHHGPLPPKHICVFKPGMFTSTLDEITIDRIECISWQENMHRNTRHRLPKELANLIAAKGALTRQINKRERQAGGLNDAQA